MFIVLTCATAKNFRFSTYSDCFPHSFICPAFFVDSISEVACADVWELLCTKKNKTFKHRKISLCPSVAGRWLSTVCQPILISLKNNSDQTSKGCQSFVKFITNDFLFAIL